MFSIHNTIPRIIYKLSHLSLLLKKNGAGGKTRTHDLLITNQLLYQLSYTGTHSLIADDSDDILSANLADGKRVSSLVLPTLRCT